MTVDDFTTFILNHYKSTKKIQGLSERSVDQYYYHARKFLLAFPNKRATEITSKDIEMFLIQYKYLKNVSNTTLCNFRTYINNFFDFLQKEEYITINPCLKVAKIKNDTVRDTPFSKTEEEKLYQSCSNVRDRALLEVLFATGCRVSEIVNANISDVNFLEKQITVIGKGNKRRTVCISEKALYYLYLWLDVRKDTNTALFVSNRKPYNRLSVNGVENILSAISEKAQVQNCHPHRCRATLATRLIDSGMDIHKVSKLLGHADVGTTMIYYRGNYDVSNDYNKLTNSL